MLRLTAGFIPSPKTLKPQVRPSSSKKTASLIVFDSRAAKERDGRAEETYRPFRLHHQGVVI
jgi:hypothetical protein